MPLPVITDTLRVAVNFKMANGHLAANVLHYRKTAALTFAGAIAVLDPILEHLYMTSGGAGVCWQEQAPGLASMIDFRYTPLDGTSATTVIPHAGVGANGGEPLPSQVALVGTLRTAQRGRRHRGRVYTAPYTESANTASAAPLGSVVSGMNTRWATHLSNLAGSGVSLVVASYLSASATDVASVTFDPTWDTQRRRQQ